MTSKYRSLGMLEKGFLLWPEYSLDKTLCNLMNCSLPRSSVHWILQSRLLEWAAISFSRGSSWPRDQSQISRIAGGSEPLGKPIKHHHTNKPSNLWATLRVWPLCQARDAVDGEAKGHPRRYLTREKCPFLSLSLSLMKLLNQDPCKALGHRAQGWGPQEALLMGNSRAFLTFPPAALVCSRPCLMTCCSSDFFKIVQESLKTPFSQVLLLMKPYSHAVTELKW